MSKQELRDAIFGVKRKLEEIKDVSLFERYQLNNVKGLIVELVGILESDNTGDFDSKYRIFITKLNELIDKDNLNFHRAEWDVFVSRLNSLKEGVFGKEDGIGRRSFLKKSISAAAGVGLIGRKAFGDGKEAYCLIDMSEYNFDFYVDLIIKVPRILVPFYLVYQALKIMRIGPEEITKFGPPPTHISAISDFLLAIGGEKNYFPNERDYRLIILTSYCPYGEFSKEMIDDIKNAVISKNIEIFVYCYMPPLNGLDEAGNNKYFESIKKQFLGYGWSSFSKEVYMTNKLEIGAFTKKIKSWK